MSNIVANPCKKPAAGEFFLMFSFTKLIQYLPPGEGGSRKFTALRALARDICGPKVLWCCAFLESIFSSLRRAYNKSGWQKCFYERMNAFLLFTKRSSSRAEWRTQFLMFSRV